MSQQSRRTDVIEVDSQQNAWYLGEKNYQEIELTLADPGI